MGYAARYRRERWLEEDEGELSPGERAELARQRKERELSTAELITMGIWVAIPMGIPILAVIFRPLLGVGNDLSIVWAVLLGVSLSACALVIAFVVPKAKYRRTSLMVTCASIGYFVLLSVLSVKVVPLVGWIGYESEEGNFVIDMPGTPTERTPLQHQRTISREFHGYTYRAFGYSYGVIYFDVDAAARKMFERLIDGVEERGRKISSALDEAAAKLLTFDELDDFDDEGALSLQGFRGRRQVKQLGGTTIIADLYLVNSRVYIVAMEGKTLNPESVLAKKFLGSFRLINPPRNNGGSGYGPMY